MHPPYLAVVWVGPDEVLDKQVAILAHQLISTFQINISSKRSSGAAWKLPRHLRRLLQAMRVRRTLYIRIDEPACTRAGALAGATENVM